MSVAPNPFLELVTFDEEEFLDLLRPCVGEMGVPIEERFQAPTAYDVALLKAVRLAPTLEVCEALLREEEVPLSRLDAKWAKAYGLR